MSIRSERAMTVYTAKAIWVGVLTYLFCIANSALVLWVANPERSVPLAVVVGCMIAYSTFISVMTGKHVHEELSKKKREG